MTTISPGLTIAPDGSLHLDITAMEAATNAPHWLSPAMKQQHERDAIREFVRSRSTKKRRAQAHDAALARGWDMAFDAAAWNEAKHPRGQPENAGEFGPGGGAGKPKGGEGQTSSANPTASKPKPAHTLASALALAFVSPNIAEHLDFGAAVQGLASPRQKALMAASAYINSHLGLRAQDHKVVGAWADGAENSLLTETDGASWDQLTTAAAMKGHLADQKAILAFLEDAAGPATLFKFHANGDLNTIHKGLLEDGVAFHTIEPDNGGAMVYVADLDGSAQAAVIKAAEQFNATVEHHQGRAEFVGTTKDDGTDRDQRDDARRAYETVIGKSPIQGSQALWKGILDRWSKALTEQPVKSAMDAAANHWRHLVKVFNPAP